MKKTKIKNDKMSVKKQKDESEKKEITSTIYNRENYTFYIFVKYLPSEDIYEVFLSIANSKKTTGGLKYKCFKTKLLTWVYYKYLKFYVIHKKILFLMD